MQLQRPEELQIMAVKLTSILRLAVSHGTGHLVAFITAETCLSDNWFMNEIADTVFEAMPMIAQVSISLPVHLTHKDVY